MEPFTYVELRIKVRPYLLHSVLAEFGNTQGNREELEKTDTPQRLNLLLDKRVYLTMEAGEKFNDIGRNYIRRPVTNSLCCTLEDEFRHFFKTCFSTGEASFEHFPGKCVVIQPALEFDYY